MPRFMLMEVEKPLLNPKKVYIEKEDNINLIYGYGIDHNIMIYDKDNEYIKQLRENFKDNIVVKNMMEVTIEREEYNIKDIYNLIRTSAIKSGMYNHIHFPKYKDIKDIIYRNIYDKKTGRFLYTTNSMFVGNSPRHKTDNIYSTIFIGGDYGLEIKNSIERVVGMRNKYANHPLIKKTKVKYYALSVETIYIEDNYLDIFPYDYHKYLPARDGIIDKLYRVKALETIGLTDEISSRWVEGKSILITMIGDEEENVETCVFPPNSFNYRVFGPDDYGDWDDYD